MEVLLFLAVSAYVFWIVLLRRSYFGMKFKKDKDGIVFQSDITNEELMKLLQEKLVYPDLKEMHYDENGQVVLVCKYGQHILTTENGRLYVGREFIPKGTPSFKEMRNMEEAECLKVYLQKVYDPNCNINPYNKYKKLKNYNIHKIGVVVALLLVCIYGVVSALDDSGIKEESESKGISSGYLTDYSSDATVGEAFSNFFAKPEWVSYEQGTTQYVDYKGICSFQGDENAVAIVTFVVSGDNFQVDKITINGQDIGIINHNSFLQTVYGISTSSSDDTTNESTSAKQEETATTATNNAGTDNNFAETPSINEAMNGAYDAYTQGINDALVNGDSSNNSTSDAAQTSVVAEYNMTTQDYYFKLTIYNVSTNNEVNTYANIYYEALDGTDKGTILAQDAGVDEIDDPASSSWYYQVFINDQYVWYVSPTSEGNGVVVSEEGTRPTDINQTIMFMGNYSPVS